MLKGQKDKFLNRFVGFFVCGLCVFGELVDYLLLYDEYLE